MQGHTPVWSVRCESHGRVSRPVSVFDELDSPSEFFFDEAASKLYYYHNGTGAPPPEDVFVVPHLQVLVNHTGTSANPVSDITYKGITFTAAATTIMAPHGVPSGGDWGLERLGAVLFQVRGIWWHVCAEWLLNHPLHRV